MAGRPKQRLSTRLVHGSSDEPGAGLSPVLDRSATFRLTEASELALATGKGADRENIYGRYGSDTLREACALLAQIEGAEAAGLFASGTAAAAAAMFELVPARGTIAVASALYGGTEVLLRDEMSARGARVVRFDAGDPTDLARVVDSDDPDLVWCESISNPLLEVADLAGLAAVCRAADVPLAVDSTFAAGIAVRPLELGASLVVHSATKFINGHSDVVGGLACADAELIRRIWSRMVRLGGCMDPAAAWLVSRGARTLPLRWQRQVSSAAVLADRLAVHPAVRRVFYPGRADHPSHAVVSRILSDGGAMVSFELPDSASARRLLADVEICVHATSLGGLETLLCLPARSSHASLEPEERERLGIRDGLVRMSVGIEDPEDLWWDLERALGALAG